MSNLNSLQTTIRDLKEIVQRNQGSDHEASHLVRQIELTLSEIERKTGNRQTLVVGAAVQSVPVS